MKIAVVGGGLFGATAAIHAARAGHEVHLIERNPSLMSGATASTYARLHRGYHYPRSPETGRESRAAEASFRAEYSAAVIDHGEKRYIVPEVHSKLGSDAFRAFLEAERLPFAQSGGVFRVREPRVHVAALQAIVRQKVRDAGVHVRTGVRRRGDLRLFYDQIVVAAYAGTNAVLRDLGLHQQVYKFQVVERPVVLLPPCFRDASVVIVDGPFGCIDPVDDGPLHMLGHVVHTVHASNVGTRPDIPAHLLEVIDKGLTDPPFSRVADVVQDLAFYVDALEEVQYVGSSFTVRAVLAGVEESDARPTLVDRLDDQVIRVFSGKLGTAVEAAQRVMAMIGHAHAEAA